MVETASRDQERTQDTHGGASETGTMERQCEGGERSDAILIRQKARLPTRTHCVLSIARIFAIGRKKREKKKQPRDQKMARSHGLRHGDHLSKAL